MSALLKEVAAILADQGSLPCSVEVGPDADGRALQFTVRIEPPIGVMALGLRHELEYLAGMDQLRRLAEMYEIDPVKLEALLAERSARP